MSETWMDFSYLVAAVLFIVGIKMMNHPKTAVKGNMLGGLGMLIAIVVTLTNNQIISYEWIIVGLAAGTIVGALFAIKVKMTDMPQMVALLNGFGGGASTLVAGAELITTGSSAAMVLIATVASGLIGAVTFWGSLVAFGKLQGIVTEKSVHYPAQHWLNLLLGLVAIGLGVWLILEPSSTWLYWVVVGVSTILGITLVLPIGGADMPVVISLLNSYSGIAAAATGFVLGNNVLIITGALVGASGVILSQIMCKAMNRSLLNVLSGISVGGDSQVKADDIYKGRVKSVSPEELAMIFDGVRRVVIVPGYGMAVAQAQHAVRDLMNLLESKGAEVEFAIHPVAGRMPGHMNILLAEANVPYDKLKEMDVINSSFEQTDVAIVIGANDVVNPLARTDPNSPIAGMPILNVDKARTVVVIKRSLSPGFAGIPNPLFAADNCLMYFADGKQAVLDLIGAIKSG